ncbi:MAG: type IV toxin-antitoxin system AbiEi family antitoxin domain-containing protein [Solirubrobacteraceae bacterium]|nr:type IV toxin-antitoxin system AbiEi family antitoxin domain-containing protein [Solirubrobacteraceae bacterium]
MSLGPRGRSATPPDLLVARKAARQHGRIRFDQLVACGLDDGAVARRVTKGQLHRLHLGVYAVGHPGQTIHAQLMGAVLAGGDGAFTSHWASSSLWGFVRWDDRWIDVTVRGSSHRKPRDGIRFHRSRSIARHDVTRRHGIPTTTAARALLDVAPLLSDERLKRAVRQAQAERSTNVKQIADVVRRANGHRGAKRLVAIISSGPAPTRSGDEDGVLDMLLAAGIEHPTVNGQYVTRSARGGTAIYYPDFRWPAQRLILEVDSAWHDGAIAHDLDAERQADLEAAGERVLRTTQEQALLHPRQLIERLIAAGAPIGRRIRS